jgi:hypothetical protein
MCRDRQREYRCSRREDGGAGRAHEVRIGSASTNLSRQMCAADAL